MDGQTFRGMCEVRIFAVEKPTPQICTLIKLRVVAYGAVFNVGTPHVSKNSPGGAGG